LEKDGKPRLVQILPSLACELRIVKLPPKDFPLTARDEQDRNKNKSGRFVNINDCDAVLATQITLPLHHDNSLFLPSFASFYLSFTSTVVIHHQLFPSVTPSRVPASVVATIATDTSTWQTR
jgi:hypothetical protein